MISLYAGRITSREAISATTTERCMAESVSQVEIARHQGKEDMGVL
jgi:hypothetical protein